MKKKKAKKVSKRLKKNPLVLVLSTYDGFLLMDALAGFKETPEWAELYQRIGTKVFESYED